MRASILAVVAVALIVGLGMVFVVKQLGLLNPPPPPPEPVVTAPPPPPPTMVLAPVRALFEGDTVSPADIRPRPLRPEEAKEYEANKADYLPPVPEVAHWRFPAHDIVADTPLKRADLKPIKKPEPLFERLSPGCRAVTVLIPKENSASGLIQVGDWVDVHLVTDVSRTDNPARVPQAGLLVPRARVVAKRDSLYSIFAPLPPGEPVSYTLATNPYRAALIEYGRTVGMLEMVPVSAAEKKRLDEAWNAELKNPQPKSAAVPFAAPGTPEYRAELDRIERYTRGELVVGTDDLLRVLDLKPLPPPAPPVEVEVYSGVNRSGTATFAPSRGPAAPQYQFHPPLGPDGKPLKPAGKK